ncbi:DUF2029 domain-containing protein [Rhodococcoides yunnanense]|uniref:DUF2029 domain-containing protein n=1 Tax=Rhodococcoides yunnanense TaxID=278209 RepID=A0ABU4BJ53_9NOCA|nr:DUF2029 domain-containing protein [Rhodococcus yunnanensis]MDV6264226.1 DUF2029 domain-containing protein [Rhodococcus yunnanensis]
MSAFTKAMRFVGDLDDEFYDDERQRDVWNEASAIGFQLFYWSALIGAAILAWTGSTAGAWFALGILVVATLISSATLAYSAARGVNLYTAAKLGRVRGVVAGAIMAAGFIGALVRLQPDVYSQVSSWAGAVVGAVAGGGVALLIIWQMRKRNARFEAGEI